MPAVAPADRADCSSWPKLILPLAASCSAALRACGRCHGQVARCAAACGAADACGHGAAGAKGHGGDGAGKDVRKGSVQSALLDVGFVRAPAQLGVEPDEFLVV